MSGVPSSTKIRSKSLPSVLALCLRAYKDLSRVADLIAVSTCISVRTGSCSCTAAVPVTNHAGTAPEPPAYLGNASVQLHWCLMLYHNSSSKQACAARDFAARSSSRGRQSGSPCRDSSATASAAISSVPQQQWKAAPQELLRCPNYQICLCKPS